MKAIYNGELIDETSVSINPNDLIVQRGYGIFDFFRIVNFKPLFIDDHLQRFVNSAERARLPIKWKVDQLKSMIYQLTESNRLEEGGVKLLLTGGVSPMGFEMGSPNLIITQNNASCPDEQIYKKGSNLISYEYLRDLPSVKTTNYFTGVWLYPEMKENSAIDVLYHHQGAVLELSRSNIFLVINGKLITPKESMLLGITRSKIIKLAQNVMPVERREVRLEELAEASEIFITSTLKKVMPIVKIDELVIGDGKVGVFSKVLLEKFEKMTESLVG